MVCEKDQGPSVIDLPKLPMTEIYTPEIVPEPGGILDQSFHFCLNCGHAQLKNVIDVGLQYGETFSYFFRSGASHAAKESATFFMGFMDRVIGNKTVVKVAKNKLAPPFTKVYFDILYGKGISYEGDLIENALQGEIINQSGSWFSFNNEKVAQGRENLRVILSENEIISRI